MPGQQEDYVETFTVDAALLRELGERLVGQHHIALAELIKNSYDADARCVRIEFTGDTIVVEDDGHGMSSSDFKDYWMRVGTTHKARDGHSPELQRPYTGSKGVGRLAAQLLARELRLTSVALREPTTPGHDSRRLAADAALHPRLRAIVDWDLANTRDDLTSVTVDVSVGGTRETFVGQSRCGTRLELVGLSTEWNERTFRSLAQEVWALSPPYEVDEDSGDAFRIELVSPHNDVVESFGDQMEAILQNWRHRILYGLGPDDGQDVDFEFDPYVEPVLTGEDDDAPDAAAERNLDAPSKILMIMIEPRSTSVAPAMFRVRVPHCLVDSFACEIRVFNLSHRQGGNVAVDDARQYMRRFGGVHIYDGGFRLPYYGPQDWLDLERDHARRLSRSQLLPKDMRLARQLHDLPSGRRVYGVAKISTAHESAAMEGYGVPRNEALAIQVSRDRLADNGAYRTLQRLVRLGLDLYADGVHRRPKSPKRFGATPETRPSTLLGEVRAAVEAARENLGPTATESLLDGLAAATTASKNSELRSDAYAALLGPLATVGMTTLAWDHESNKHRRLAMDVALRLEVLAPELPLTHRTEIAEMAERLRRSAVEAQQLAGLFRPIMDSTRSDAPSRVRARLFVSQTAKAMAVLARGAVFDVSDVPPDLWLPAASAAEWTAIVQNLVINALNAVLGASEQVVRFTGGASGAERWLRIEDTGDGVDLVDAESYFEPFVRGRPYDPARAQAGLGGSGLGLTIVRMLADPLGVRVAFEVPSDGFSTAVVLRWREA